MAQAINRVLRQIDERRVLRHALFWLVVGLLEAALLRYKCVFVYHAGLALLFSLVLVLCAFGPATYALLYGVLPELWAEQPRYGRLLLRALGWLSAASVLSYAVWAWGLLPLRAAVAAGPLEQHLALSPAMHLPLLLTAGAAAGLWGYRRWRRKELLNEQLQQENYRAELQLLQAQIHPHFLFNTLNNLYALTLRQSDEAPRVVERLRALLHFVVEQGHAPLVSLRDEVALLRNYVALEQLRYGPRLTVVFEAPAMPARAGMAPLLLLPLVENAFKHGSAEQVGAARIVIRLGLDADDLICSIHNSKNADAPAGAGGIGLSNVRQRLQLLYPGQHQIGVEVRPDTFTVQLRLRLRELEAAAPPRRRAWQGAGRRRQSVRMRATLAHRIPA
ncbi:histidine kinase [Hymenobacter sp. 15J16-1T3B]|uniref:sensor histidine kinase n=1 Tax=Hymenobacter sp. 15J16-1T3B TaxID=2886941 RepID=UPI001D10661D|nr:histidine kinase [Hymenobacter sp. 15J16-1T3B]MCC3158935.1 histidine kinase [Hymenobacter sp. 15J16-1T3B]